jgi:hypothetical protein
MKKTIKLMGILLVAVMASVAYAAESQTLEPGKDWFEWRMPWDSSVVDLSFLTEAPAGKHGVLKTHGRDLRFEDGTPMKIWGMNVVAIACMPAKIDAPVLARNVRRRGFNLVRFHYFDSRWATEARRH